MQKVACRSLRLLPPDDETLHPFKSTMKRRVWERPDLHPDLANPWTLSEELWAQLEPLITAIAPRPSTGRPSKPARLVIEGILYVLRMGCAWKSLPAERFGSASAIHATFKRWYVSGLFEAIWDSGLAESPELEGIAWRWYYKTVQTPREDSIPVFLKRGETELGGHAIKVWRPEIRERKPRPQLT